MFHFNEHRVNWGRSADCLRGGSKQLAEMVIIQSQKKMYKTRLTVFAPTGLITNVVVAPILLEQYCRASSRVHYLAVRTAERMTFPGALLVHVLCVILTVDEVIIHG